MNLLYTLMHISAGFITVLSLFTPTCNSLRFLLFLTCLLGFVGYETLQYLEENDWPTGELREFMGGFYLGVVSLIVLDVVFA